MSKTKEKDQSKTKELTKERKEEIKKSAHAYFKKNDIDFTKEPSESVKSQFTIKVEHPKSSKDKDKTNSTKYRIHCTGVLWSALVYSYVKLEWEFKKKNYVFEGHAGGLGILHIGLEGDFYFDDWDLLVNGGKLQPFGVFAFAKEVGYCWVTLPHGNAHMFAGGTLVTAMGGRGKIWGK